MRTKRCKKSLIKSILLILILQALQLDALVNVFNINQVQAFGWIKTAELKILADTNPDLIKTYTKQKEEKIEEIQKKLGDEIEKTWYGAAKTEKDKIKKEQLKLINKLEDTQFNHLDQKKKAQIEGILELEEVSTFFEVGENKREIIPTLKKSEKEDYLNPESAPFTMEIPEISGIEKIISLNPESNNWNEFKTNDVKFNQIGARRVQGVVEDNKILYRDIYEGVDLLTTSLENGVKEDLILKNSTEINLPESMYHGDGKWIFDYTLELNNLEVIESESGLKFLNQAGEEVLFTPAPYMLDRNGKISYDTYFEIVRPETEQAERVQVDSQEIVATQTGSNVELPATNFTALKDMFDYYDFKFDLQKVKTISQDLYKIQDLNDPVSDFSFNAVYNLSENIFTEVDLIDLGALVNLKPEDLSQKILNLKKSIDAFDNFLNTSKTKTGTGQTMIGSGGIVIEENNVQVETGAIIETIDNPSTSSGLTTFLNNLFKIPFAIAESGEIVVDEEQINLNTINSDLEETTRTGSDTINSNTGSILNKEEDLNILPETDLSMEESVEINTALIQNIQKENKKNLIYIRLVANTNGLEYPIDLDPTVYVKMYDRGARTFAPNFADGNQNGKYSQTNNPGRINRGTEGNQTNGIRTLASTSGSSVIDASGDIFTGDNTVNSQNWLAVGNSLRTNIPSAKAQFTTTIVTEIWVGLTYSPVGGIVKATIDKGTDFEVVNYIDTYADEIQAEQKTLLATGLRNTTHTVELELTNGKNIKYDKNQSGSGVSIDYIETYSPNSELETLSLVGTAESGTITTLIDSSSVLTQTGSNAYQGFALTFTSGANNGKTVYIDSSAYNFGSGTVALTFSPAVDTAIDGTTTYQVMQDGIKINNRASRGINIDSESSSEWQIEFGIEGNLPNNSAGQAEKGSFSIWVKPDFSATADALQHYVFDTGLQRLYYDGSDDKWHFEVWNGTDWTTNAITSAVQTFTANTSLYLVVTWNANSGLKLSVNGVKTIDGNTWTAQGFLSANEKITIGNKGGKSPLEVSQENLAGYWDMDSDFSDKSGNGNNGIGWGGVNLNNGKFNQAGSFDGVDDYIDMGDPVNGSLDFGTNNFSISSWIKSSVNANTQQSIISKGGNASYEAGFRFLLEPNDLTFYLSDGTVRVAPTTVGAGTNLSDDKWHFVSATVDRINQVVTLYIDWEIYGTINISSVTGSVSNSRNFEIGRIFAATGREFNGSIDDVSIYNKTLSATEIIKLYRNAKHFNGTLAEPQIFDYVLGDSEIYDIYTSANPSIAQTVTQKMEAETSYSGESKMTNLLFNAPMVSTPHDRIGTLAGQAKLSSTQSGIVGSGSALTYYGDPLGQAGGVLNSNGLVGYWKMDPSTSAGQVLDSSGNNNNGTWNGWASAVSGGKFDWAGSFDGVDDFVEIAHNSWVNLQEKITISTWIKWSESSYAEAQRIVSKWDSTAYELSWDCQTSNPTCANSGYGNFNFSVNGVWNQLSTSSIYSKNSWHNVIGSYDWQKVKLYIDGNLTNEITYTGAIATNTDSLFIGKNSQALPKYFTGLIDETALWNRALSENEITNLYQAQKRNYLTYTTPEATTEIIAGLDVWPDKGITRIILDGDTPQELITEIDTYSSTATQNQRFLVATGLESKIHTVKIENTSIANLNANGSIVTPKFIETKSASGIVSDSYSINGKYVDNVIVQDYAYFPTGVQFPDKGNISENTHNGSLEAWLKTPWAGDDGIRYDLLDTRNSTNLNGILLSKFITNQLVFRYNDNTENIYVLSYDLNATNWPANTPHHIFIRWSRSTSNTMSFSLYLNGKKVAENKSFPRIPTNHTKIKLGQVRDGAESELYDLDGSIYDFSIYDKAFDDGGVAIGEMASTGSSVFNAYKSIASNLEQIKPISLDSVSGTANSINGTNQTFALKRWGLLNASGAIATLDSVNAYVNGVETILTDIKAGTYARLNDSDGISALDTSIVVDSIVNESAIPDTGFLYLGNPTGHLKREKVYYSAYNSGVFTWLIRGVDSGQARMTNWVDSWTDNTIVEVVGNVTFETAPATNSDIFIEYNYSGDAVDRSRSVSTNYQLPTTNFLDQTDLASTGWSLDTITAWTSGSWQMITEVKGQTAQGYFHGTDMTLRGAEGDMVIYIDEGTAGEKQIQIPASAGMTNWVRKTNTVATGLKDGLHSYRIVSQGNISIDGIEVNWTTPVLQKNASTEIYYEQPLADLNPLTSGEGKVNDVYYWDTTESEVGSLETGEKRVNLLADLTATSTTAIVESVDYLPASGVVKIGDEQIFYGSKATDGITSKLLNLQRGYNQTTASAHLISTSEKIIEGLGNVNDMYLYDTTKDNFDNTWRFDKIKSWYNENSSSTRCPNGYQESGNQKCTRAFPEIALLVTTDTTMKIYDAESREVWMQFNEVGWNILGNGCTGGCSHPSVFALNGKIYVAHSPNSQGLGVANFVADKTARYKNDGKNIIVNGTVANRNVNNPAWESKDTSQALLSGAVNDIHGAVVNGKTYIAVATDEGVSVINETDGTVVDIVMNSQTSDDTIMIKLFLTSKGNLYIINQNKTNGKYGLSVYYNVQDIISDESFIAEFRDVFYQVTNPAIQITANTPLTSLFVTENTSPFGGNSIYIATDNGVSVIQEKQGDETNGSVKYITNEYTTEEMVGDIRGMWTFDGSVPLTDNSVKTNDLTNNGGVTLNSDGVRNKAASFDGVDDYLEKTDDASLDLNWPLTLSAWINPSAITTGHHIFYKGEWTGYGNRVYHAYLNSAGKIVFSKSNGSGIGLFDDVANTADGLTSKSTLPLNQWSHILMVWDGTTTAGSMKIYINGKLDNSAQAQQSTILNSAGPFRIGAQRNVADGSAGSPFNGLIDEPFVTAEALDTATIKRIYETGKKALASTNEQKLGGSSNFVKSLSVIPAKAGILDSSNLWVATGTVTDFSTISKLNLASDSRVQTIDTNSSFGGAMIETFNTPVSVSVGDAGVYFAGTNEVYTDFAEVQTFGNFTADNQGDWTKNGTASWYKEAGPMPAQLKIVAMDTGLSLINSNDHSLWMHFAKGAGNAIATAVNAVTVADGAIFAGTENGVIKIDFANDEIIKIVGQKKYSPINLSNLFGDRNAGKFFYSDEKILHQGDLVGMWTMDETIRQSQNEVKVVDSSGNGNHPTVYGDTTFTTDGPSGKAASFDGAGDYLELSDNDWFSFGNGTNDVSFSGGAWIKPTSTTSEAILSKYDSTGNQREWTFRVRNGKLELFLVNPAGNNQIARITTTDIATNTWSYVNFTYNGSSISTGIKLYINGQEISATSSNAGTYTAMTNWAGKIGIGAHVLADGAGTYFSGLIDEPFLLKRTLSASEISDLYQVGLANLRAGHTTSISSSPYQGEMRRGFVSIGTKNIEDATASKVYVIDKNYTDADRAETAISGTIGKWDFEKTTSSGSTVLVSDNSGNANIGTVYGPTTFTTGGPIGQAMLSATGSYLEVADSSNLDITSNLTLSAWVKANAIDGTSKYGIFDKGSTDTNAEHAYGLSIYNGVPEFSIGNNLVTESVSGSTLLNTDWNLLTATANGSKLSMYVNGVLVKTATQTISPYANTATLKIGARQVTTGIEWNFNGLIDQPIILNRVLNTDEITSLYNAGRIAMQSSNLGGDVRTTKFDSNGDLYYAGGTTLYKESGDTFGKIGEFGPDANVDLGSVINDLTMDTDYLYIATDNGVKKVAKANLAGGAIQTIDSSNTDATVNQATSIDYQDNKLVIVFSSGGGGTIVVWNTSDNLQHASYNNFNVLTGEILHNAAWADKDVNGELILATEEGITTIDFVDNPSEYNTLEIISGNNQLGEMLSPLNLPLRVRVGDGNGSYAGANVMVNFTIVSQPIGIGTGAVLASSSVATNLSGFAETVLTLGDRAGDYQVNVDFAGNTSGVKTFTAREKEKFILKIVGDNQHTFNLDPHGSPYSEKSNTLVITHNAQNFDFKAIVDQFPTDGTNTIEDWNGVKGFAWMDNRTPTAFGSGATVYSATGPVVNQSYPITFRIKVDYYNPISSGYTGQVNWDVANLSF